MKQFDPERYKEGDTLPGYGEITWIYKASDRRWVIWYRVRFSSKKQRFVILDL